MKEPKPFLLHILDYCDTTRRLTSALSFNQFTQDEKTQLAVIKALEIIGEASTHLEADFRQSHPQIPWKAIISFRNKVIHQYWDIDLKTVWRIATKDVPQLKNDLLPILQDLSRPEPTEGETQKPHSSEK